MTFPACSVCGHASNRVADTRYVCENNTIRRRRKCQGCGHRWTTYEFAVELAPEQLMMKIATLKAEACVIKASADEILKLIKDIETNHKRVI